MSSRSLRQVHDVGGEAIETRDRDASSSTAPAKPESRETQGTYSSTDPAIAVVRTTVNLHPDAVAALRQMAADRGTTVAEIIRRAIWMEKYVHDALKEGSKILVQDADRALKELVIR
jgi:hypothetical protein